jgi:hypothetical protein
VIVVATIFIRAHWFRVSAKQIQGAGYVDTAHIKKAKSGG